MKINNTYSVHLAPASYSSFVEKQEEPWWNKCALLLVSRETKINTQKHNQLHDCRVTLLRLNCKFLPIASVMVIPSSINTAVGRAEKISSRENKILFGWTAFSGITVTMREMALLYTTALLRSKQTGHYSSTHSKWKKTINCGQRDAIFQFLKVHRTVPESAIKYWKN